MAFFPLHTVRGRMYELLKDGVPRTRAELITCLHDDLADPSAVYVHVSMMRKKVRKDGNDIVITQDKGVNYYRLVKLAPLVVPAKSQISS